MIILDFISTFFEDFLLSYVIVNFFKVDLHKNRKYFILTLLCMGFTYFFNYALVNNNVLIIVLCLIFCIFLILEKHNFSLLYLVIPLFLVIAILMCNILSLTIISGISNTPLANLSGNISLFLTAILLSRILIFLVCITVLKIRDKGISFFNIKKYWVYIPFIFTIALMFTTLIESIIYQNVTLKIIYRLSIEMIILTALGTCLFIFIYKQGKQNALYSQQILENEYQKKLSYLVQNSLDKISNDKHMMMYSLLNIKNQIPQADKMELMNLVNVELNKYLNYNFISSTGNYFFDYEITCKIQELYVLGYEVKVLFSVNEKTPILNNTDVVSYLITCIDTVAKEFTQNKRILLFLDEKDDYVSFKITIPENIHNPQIIFPKSPSCLKKQDIYNHKNQIDYSFLFKAND